MGRTRQDVKRQKNWEFHPLHIEFFLTISNFLTWLGITIYVKEQQSIPYFQLICFEKLQTVIASKQIKVLT